MFTLDSLRDAAFSWPAALSLASASKLAYEPLASLERITLGSWGFQQFHPLDRGETQGFIAIGADVVLVSFRGTEGLADWLGNLDIRPIDRPYGVIHNGFFEAFDSVAADITNVLPAASLAAKKVWLTGHSLGGALATVMAAEMRERIPIAGIHTFGQPRVGNGAVRQLFETHYRDTFARLVNDDDVVPRVPPGYVHVGRLIHFDQDGNVQSSLPGLPQESTAATAEPPPLTKDEFDEVQREVRAIQAQLRARGQAEASPAVDRSLEGLLPSLSDHRMDRYIALIRRFVPRSAMRSVLPAERSVRVALESAESAGLRPAHKRNTDSVPVLLRVRDASWRAPAWLDVISRVGNIVAARGSLDALQRLEEDQGVVSIEASREGGSHELATSLPFVAADHVHRPPISERGDRALVGIIDGGIDVLHEAFLDAAGRSRILAVWDQRVDTAGQSPHAVDGPSFAFVKGTLYLATDIDQFVTGARPTPAGLRDAADGHGTHVTSIAAGRGIGGFSSGMAPDARIVVVIPELKTSPGAPQSLGYSISHLQALEFLKRVSEGGTRVVAEALPMAINVSLGMNAGAHDGTSNLEAAFDSITNKGKTEGLVIVKSAGNERGFGGHARVQAFHGVFPVEWTSSVRVRREDYIEVWYDSNDEIEFQLVDPAGSIAATASLANPNVTATLGGNTCNLHLTRFHPDNGDNLLAISITPQAAEIQPGRWVLNMTGVAILSGSGQVDAWVERDSDARAVRFIPDDPGMTLSIPGTANTVITVAACHSAAPLQLAPFSSMGPTRKGGAKPDIAAPGMNIIAARAGLPDHRATIAKPGTSMAAPHVTGALALVLSHRNKQAGRPLPNANQIRKALIKSAGFFISPHNPGVGNGMLNAERLLAELK